MIEHQTADVGWATSPWSFRIAGWRTKRAMIVSFPLLFVSEYFYAASEQNECRPFDAWARASARFERTFARNIFNKRDIHQQCGPIIGVA
jgi:hypothetical protein